MISRISFSRFYLQIHVPVSVIFVKQKISYAIIFIIFKIVREMKSSVNKFDYPTAASHVYKIYKQNKTKDANPQTQKLKYRQFDKQQREIERQKAQKEKQRKAELERKQNKKKIQQELQRKKQQLIELQKMKNMAIEAEKKSHELALIRQEQQRIQKLENQRRSKQNQYNAQNRFLDALRRLDQEKEINSKKEKQAAFRRKVIEETEKIERGKAIRYREEVEEKQRAMEPQQICSFKDYKQTLGRTAYNKATDYTKSYLHNPNIIIQSTQMQQNAIERAERQKSRQKQQQEERKVRQEEYKQISKERGRVAMEKITLAKQYQEYLKEQEEKARLYNIERVEAGKKNQYTGVKPGTLVQMEVNKRLRGQQQFEQMFFGGSQPEQFDRPANRYNIIQNKLTNNFMQTNPKISKNITQSRSIGSVGAVVSDSHYSFESESINDLTSVKKQEEHHEQPEQKKRVIPLPKQLVEQSSPQQNVLNRSKQKEELSYSESEDENM